MKPREQSFNGANLRKLRMDKGWTQTELGNRIGAHFTSVSGWERGDNEPRGHQVLNISHEFGVSVESLYAADEDDEEAASLLRAAARALEEGHLQFLADLAPSLARIEQRRVERERSAA